MKRITLLAFGLLCSLAGYSQLALENFEGVWPPDQWSVYNFQGPQQQWVQGSTATGQPAHSPIHSAYMQREQVTDGTFTEDFLVTKPFTVPTTPQVRFWNYTTIAGNQGNIYKVMLLPTGADPALASSYILLEDYTEVELTPSAETWTFKTLTHAELNSRIGQQVRLAFVMMGDFGDRWALDDIEVVSECLIPNNLSANSITQTSATLSWNNPANATDFDIEIVEQTTAPTGVGIPISGSTYTISTLLPNTCYKYYVKAKCTATNNSNWAGPFNFCTVAPGATCNAPLTITSLPYTHTSNTSLYGNDYSGSPGASCGTTNSYLSGDDVVYAYTAPQDQVITINLSDLTDTYTGMFVYTSCADIGVNCYEGAYNGFSTDNLIIEQMPVTAGVTYYILISTWPSPNNVGYTINIQVENCAKPTNLTATGATTSSIVLGWQEAGTATSWQYVMQPVGTGVPAGSGITSGTTSVPIGSLPASTGYEVYVRSDCGDGTFSSWTGPVLFNTLCESLDLPFSEGFNTGSPTQFCWTVADSNGDGETWNMDHDFDAFEGNEVAALYTDGFNGSVDDWLISPTINLTGNQRLKYHFKVQSGFEPNNFEVLLSTSGIDAADFTQVLVPLASYENENYVEVIVNLVDGTNTPISGPVNIAWHVPPGGPDGWRLYIDNVIIEEIPSCPDPVNLAANNIDADSAVLTWTPGFVETAWDIVVQPQGAGAPTGAGVPVTGLPTFTAGPLDPSTNYEYYVRANCAVDDQSNWVGPFAFMTTQIPADLDYTQNFETTPTGWSLVNGTEANKWVIGTAVSNGGTHSLYVSNDHGVSNAYTDNVFTVVHAYRDILMPDPADQISVSFDWRSQAESCCDYLRVWAVPATFVPTPNQEIFETGDIVLLSENLNFSGTWTSQNYVMDASAFAGQVVRLVFQWRSDWSVGGQYPAAIDNINIKVITCPSPSALEASDIGLNSATITWSEPTSVSPTYDYYYSDQNIAPTETTTPNGNVADPTVGLTGLDESTIYYVWVRSNCGDEDGNSFWVGPLQFHTQCGPFTVPFFEGFNSNSSSEFCWTVTDVNGDGVEWFMDYGFNQYEGDQAAGLNTDGHGGDNDDYLISPTIQLTGNQRLKFRHRVYSSFEPNDFEVLLSTTGTNPASFTQVLVPLATYSNEQYQEIIVNLVDSGNNGISGPVNIAWHVPPGGEDGWVLFIDNVIIEDIPPCPEPLNVEISCLDIDTATFTWEPGDAETSWQVAITPAGVPIPATGTVVNDPIYLATNLAPGTAYTFYVRAICPNDEGLGAWVTINFTTPSTSVLSANGFCSNDSEDQSILFNNTYGNQYAPLGQVACLYSTPNPVWYYLQVDDPGDLYFQLVQNTSFDAAGNPIGMGLDVDYVAYGPFNSLSEACSIIDYEDCWGCPNNTNDPSYYPEGNVIDCSYSAAPVESLTISGAQQGQIYAVLITNFSGQQGQIKLQQLETSTGSTDCNILYQVALGPDQTYCGETETTITATVTTPGQGLEPTYEWSLDGVVFTPQIVNTGELTQTITVTESGVYSVVITVPNSINTEPITDSVVITFGPQVSIVSPAAYAVCDDVANDGIAQFDLTSLNSEILGTMSNADFSVTYYANQANAETNTSPIANPEAYTNTTANTQTIYATVRSIAVPTCFAVVPVELIVKPLPVTTMPVAYTSCEGEPVTISGTAINYTDTEATYAWLFNGSPISDITENSLVVTEGGTYTLQVTLNGCVNTVDTQVNITPTPIFSFGGPYAACTANTLTVEVIAENFSAENADFEWTLNDVVVADTRTMVPQEFGTYEVKVSINGCEATQSVIVTQDTDAVDFAFLDGCENNIYMLEVINSATDIDFVPENATYTWTGPEGFITQGPLLGLTSIEPTVTGIYTVTFVTPDGCIGTSDFPVDSTSCFIQRGISPGDADKNNEFDLSALNVKHLSIFNRYGQEVYSRNNYTKEWIGQDKSGKELPTGTYFYSIERDNGETKTGWVYINRQN